MSQTQRKPAPPANKPPSQSGQAAAAAQSASGAGDAATPEKPKRSRAALSTVKRLAIAVAAIVSASAAAGQKLSDELVKAIEAGKVIADEVNANSLKPIEDRLAALKTEIAAAATLEALNKPGGALALHKLTQEMQRLENRRKALVEKGGISATPA